MGSTSSITPDTNYDDNRANMTQSPVAHDNSYSPSPSTSTSFNYANAPSRSVPELQIPVTPKATASQQQHQQLSPQQPVVPQMKTTPKQQPMPKPSIVTQQCNFWSLLFTSN